MSRFPSVRIEAVELRERPMALRLPFKFGAATLTHAPQVFARVRASVGGVPAEGMAAELLSAKWFDKDPALSTEDNFEQLRLSLRLGARRMEAAGDAGGAHALHVAVQADHARECAQAGLNGLIASYGTALIDRALIDALCRARGVSIVDAVRTNLLGLDATTAPDLWGVDLDRILARSPFPRDLAARHTVGMADALTEGEIEAPVDDGLPESLEGAIAAYGHRHFKLKIGAGPEADVERLTRIAAVLDAIGEPYMVSLDGNEQFEDVAAVADLLDAIEATPVLDRLRAATAYVEQPIARSRALEEPVHALAGRVPLALDESDAHTGVFAEARALGYAAISSKTCKGVYRALINAARCAHWNVSAGEARHFMIAEDLSTQAGLSVQQDLALAALVGAGHVERNGHHYVDGFGDAPPDEQARFAERHPDLYRVGDDGRAHLRIAGGRVSLASLAGPGFASAVLPSPDGLAPLGGVPASGST